jgi:hypothetical protein
MDGKPAVFRLVVAVSEASDTPAIRRIAPRNVSVIFIIVFLALLRDSRLGGPSGKARMRPYGPMKKDSSQAVLKLSRSYTQASRLAMSASLGMSETGTTAIEFRSNESNTN